MAFVSDVELKPAPLDAWRASCRGNPNIAEYRELHRRVLCQMQREELGQCPR